MAGSGNDGLLLVFDLAGVAAGGFDGFHNSKGFFVCDFAEDDVLAVEPAGDDSGDEELGAVAVGKDGRGLVCMYVMIWLVGWYE